MVFFQCPCTHFEGDSHGCLCRQNSRYTHTHAPKDKKKRWAIISKNLVSGKKKKIRPAHFPTVYLAPGEHSEVVTPLSAGAYWVSIQVFTCLLVWWVWLIRYKIWSNSRHLVTGTVSAAHFMVKCDVCVIESFLVWSEQRWRTLGGGCVY